MGELLARIRAVLRRSSGKEGPPRGAGADLRSGHIWLEMSSRRLTAGGDGGARSRTLTNLKFRLFGLFMAREGEILSRDEILDHLFEGRPAVDGRSLSVYINRARKILSELGADPGAVSTV